MALKNYIVVKVSLLVMDIKEDLNIKSYREKFRKIYRSKIRAVFHKFERERQKRLAKCIITTSVFAVITASVFIFGFLNDNLSKALFQIIFILGIITLIIPAIFNSNFISDLKSKCMPEFMKAFDNLHWSQGFNIINEEELNYCDLFSKFNRYSTDDSFIGEHNGVKFLISESDLLYVTGHGKNKSVRTVFDGVIIRFDSNKKIISKTIIATKGDVNIKGSPITKKSIIIMIILFLPMLFFLIMALMEFSSQNNIFWGILIFAMLLPLLFIGIFLYEKDKTKNEQKLNKVNLEDVEFDKKYIVFSEDQIEARYLITPAFMERFKHIYTSFGTENAKCSFYDDKFMLAITTKKNLFEIGDLFHSLMTKKYVNAFLEELISIIMMIDYFKLNEKTML